jgi:hypothetical protein
VSVPRASIVTASYNSARFIDRTAASVLAQSEPDWEWVVADDRSEDGTPDLLEAMGDSRIRVLRRETNGGPSAARNTAIAAARAPVVVFLDHDDLWEPARLERLLGVLDGDPGLGFASTDMWVGDPQRPEGARTILENPGCRGASLDATTTWLVGCSFSASTMAVRSEALERHGGFREDLWYAQDWELALRLHLAGERAAMVAEPLGWTVMHAGQLSEGAAEGTLADRRSVLGALASSPDVGKAAVAQLLAWEREEGERRLGLAVEAAAQRPRDSRRNARAALRQPMPPRSRVAAAAYLASPRVATLGQRLATGLRARSIRSSR